MRPIHAVRTARAALTLLALTGTASVFAATYADQVVDNLQSRYDYWRNRSDGWTRLPDLRDTGMLREGGSGTVTYTLVKGNTYKIVGACDNDCSDIDFVLRDNNDNLIDSDIENDDIPVVEVSPARTGTFTLRTTMRKCSEDVGCDYGVDVFRSR